MAERGSDARSYNLFPSYPDVCFEKKKMENEEKKKKGKERNKWTHLFPKALPLQLIYQKEKKNSF